MEEEKVQMCEKCDEPTGRCGDDSLFVHSLGPLCEACFDNLDAWGAPDKEEADQCNADHRAGLNC